MSSRLLRLLAGGGVLVAVLLIAGVRLFVLFRHLRSGRIGGLGDALESDMVGGATLEALPERTLLGHGRYRILNVYAGVEKPDEVHNIYVARGTTSLSRCPKCDALIEGEEAQSCARCGADLRGVTLIYPKFLVLETANAQIFEASTQLKALGLRHPALIVPEDVFTETTFDPPRHYRVEPIFKRARDVVFPQPTEKVLRWGIALAQGMACLHQRAITLQKVDLEHIVINDGIARHVCIDNVWLLPDAIHAQADVHFAENVRALAGLLLAWLSAPAGDALEADAPGADAPVAGVPVAGAPPSKALLALLERAQRTGKTAGVFAAVLESSLRALYAPENVPLQVGALTHAGRVRALNEDSMLTLDLTARFAMLGLPVGLYAVADGMGGHAAGDVASQLTIRAIQEVVDTLHLGAAGGLPNALVWLEQITAAANQAVYTQRRAAGNDMGCTLVLALMVGGHASIANIGDSRAYWLSVEGAVQITTDHSLVERLVAAGHITVEEAREHPQRNVIYRVVGDRPKADFDSFEQVLVPGEALLLCSDGLSGMLSDTQIWELWRAAPSPQVACAQLVEAANRAGGVDNISVIIIQVGAVDRSS